MKKIFLFSLILFAVFLVFSLSNYFFYKNPYKPNALVKNHFFKLEIAKTDQQKTTGLAKYNTIPQGFGMLFPFGKPGMYAFWMKNMKFPIDIIFIRDGKIVRIFSNVPPPKFPDSPLPIYKTDSLTDTVLEINAGLSEKYGFKNGDSVKIDL